MDRAGHILDRRATASNPAAGRETMLSDMVNSIGELRESCGGEGLAGIGIGVPGFILLKEGIIRNSNNLAPLEDFPIRAEIERRLNARVILENDANAAALGEKWMGAGRGVDDLVLLTLGTGMGGGIISGGRDPARLPGDGGRVGPHNGRIRMAIRAAAAIADAWRSTLRPRRSRQWPACCAWAMA